MVWSGRLPGTVPFRLVHIIHVQHPPRHCHCYQMFSYQSYSSRNDKFVFISQRRYQAISWYLAGFTPIMIVQVSNTICRKASYTANTNQLEAASSRGQRATDGSLTSLFFLQGASNRSKFCHKASPTLSDFKYTKVKNVKIGNISFLVVGTPLNVKICKFSFYVYLEVNEKGNFLGQNQDTSSVWKK